MMNNYSDLISHNWMKYNPINNYHMFITASDDPELRINIVKSAENEKIRKDKIANQIYL